MNDLEKALERVDDEGGPHANCSEECGSRIIYDAAHRLLNLTSPETIEKAARAIISHERGFDLSDYQWSQLSEGAKNRYRWRAVKVLRSVEEGTQ